MSIRSFRLASLAAIAACAGMVATPALADRGGWGGHRHHHDGPDAGDIFAGLLVIGAVAAVASAANKAEKERQAAESLPPPPPARYGDTGSYRGDWGRSGSIDYAVDTCVNELERGTTRVDTVDGTDRDGSGWRVFGRTRSGVPFVCSVAGDGRIRSMTVDGHAPY